MSTTLKVAAALFGLSLILLGWIYQRFVFGDRVDRPA